VNWNFVVLCGIVLIVIFGGYIALNTTEKQELLDEHAQEILAQEQKQLEEMQKYEIAQHLQKYSPDLEDYIEQVPQNPTGGGEIVSLDLEEYQQENPDFNYRTDFGHRLA